jgi:hypothetical protein
MTLSDFNGNRYGSGGIKAMKRRLASLKGQFTTDQIGVRKVRQYLKGLIEEKKQARKDARKVARDWETLAGASDDNFFTKCFVKAESAAYQTVTACDYVKFAIRCKLFRRVSGRAKDYGEKEAPEGFKLSDNGIQGRMAFFKVAYKKTESNRDNYRTLPLVFAVRRNADQDNFIGLAFKGNEQAKWEFKIEPIGDIGAEIQDSGQKQVAFIENAGKVETYDHVGSQFAWTGSLVDISSNIKNALKERGPIYTNEWDLFSVRSDTQVQFSFDGGPEFRITAVTEQQVGSNTGKYTGMSLMALGIFSGRGVQDLRSITGYVTQGKKAGSLMTTEPAPAAQTAPVTRQTSLPTPSSIPRTASVNLPNLKASTGTAWHLPSGSAQTTASAASCSWMVSSLSRPHGASSGLKLHRLACWSLRVSAAGKL